MALMIKKRSEVPKDAVILSELDALKYQMDIVKDWKIQSDVFFLKFGTPILASLSAFTGMYVNNYYRLKYRLSAYGRISSYLPVVVMPTLVSAFFHQQFVVKDIMLQKSCAVCVETRAACMQGLISTIFPTILAIASSIPLAISYNTYKIPAMTENPRKVFEMLYKHTKPVGNVLFGLFVLHCFVAAFITYKETDSMFKIHTKLNELEEILKQKYDI